MPATGYDWGKDEATLECFVHALEHVGEGVYIAPLIKGLRPPAMLSASTICASATKRVSPLSN